MVPFLGSLFAFCWCRLLLTGCGTLQFDVLGCVIYLMVPFLCDLFAFCCFQTTDDDGLLLV